ncbi:class I SAM-dependent methyltransferase [Ornithinibacillus bavariensis]|uniref:Methyltransferase type 11 n=1 Tax=Ornithinibacillus bavariensis TaxID=545502 RepID=A0A919X6B1_9BACI|nr:class I SAM-dependent methyltransferase [Ornithinibacillus bavariensis]GIO25829.1 methyltransferase type 11 [Ornithinibacillus bavariensis]
MKQEKLIRKYDKQVSAYENNRDNPTLVKWRSRIIPDAYGSVLEIGIGVGANFAYYEREKVNELLGVDFSKEMIRGAEREASKHHIKTSFINKDIRHVQFESNSFDSIVSTLTLCGYPNPVDTLNKINDWCRKDGKVLLMEHGLSTNPFLSVTQKIVDPLFNKVSGCHCNRNMIKLVEKSRLQIERVERYWSGIICLIWARPRE